MHKAKYFETVSNKKVKCTLCPNYCILEDGEWGSCRSRKNVTGTLFAVNYGRTVSVNMDPIEKKPLYHYYPGTHILSLGPNSCNLHCDFCQNHEISQSDCQTEVIQPDELLDLLLRKKLHQVAFTYTEPFTWFEYILDCGKLFREKDIRIVLVTNGYINQIPLKELLPYIDALNIDLKSMKEAFYTTVCKGKLQPVLETIITCAESCHVELTNLIIPNRNDSIKDIIDLVDFVRSINSSIPVHFSRYYPNWKCKEPATPLTALHQAFQIASGKLSYVYLGNVPSGEHTDTHCPNCKKHLISRSFLSIDKHKMTGNKCSECSAIIYGKY